MTDQSDPIHQENNREQHGPTKVVAVALDMPLWDTFDYLPPEGLEPEDTLGRRVIVPFGTRRVTGYALKTKDRTEGFELKEIEDVLDEQPLFPISMVRLFEWVADYYLFPIGQVLASLLPSSLGVSLRRAASLTEKAFTFLEEGRARGDTAKILSWMKDNPGIRPPWPHAKILALARSGLIRLEIPRAGRRPMGPLLRTFVKIADGRALSNQPEGVEGGLLARIERDGPIAVSELRAIFPNTDYYIAKWERKGLLERCRLPVERRHSYGIVRPYPRPLELFPQQERSLAQIDSLLDRGTFACCLLHGVTGSGKTEIYFRAAEAAIKRGRQVLVLVPEISLATYMEGVFLARLGERTAVYHSGLGEGERYDQWIRIARGDVDLVIGARSALFAPLERLGLIIVDEEHDPAYKQDTAPRYQGRDAAVMRGKLQDALVVLGSGTPSVQSYHNSLSGKYRLLSMPERVESRPLPEIELVDMKEVEERDGESPMLSPRLFNALAENLSAGDQSLLFLNRRGYHRLYLCRMCGGILKCPNCDVALTYHKREGLLVCHYCGFSSSGAGNLRCASCGSQAFKAYGFGTERLEAELGSRLPSARIARMDADSTRRKGEALSLLKRFADKDIDILVGTQIIAKGYDFPAVTLVGVVAADMSLGFPDFRAAERTFQLLSQVAGRAGRGEKPGRVIIQTFNPSHYALTAAKNHDYQAFAARETELRSSVGYPPFRTLAVIKLQGLIKEDTREAASELAGALKAISAVQKEKIRIMGPVEAPIAKIKGRYRFQILLKAGRPFILQRILRETTLSFKARLDRRNVECIADIDSYQML